MKPLGKFSVQTTNPENHKSYLVVSDGLKPLLGAQTIQDLNLVTVNKHNIRLLDAQPIRTSDNITEFHDVFEGEGHFSEQLHLEVDETVPAVKIAVLIRRTLKPCCREVKERAYMTLVRPTIEYASSTWNPHTNTDVNRLEQVQKNAARFVCNDYNSATSTSALVSSLGWDTFEHRRLFNQSVLFYKFHNGLVNCKLPDSVTRCSSRSLARSHHLAYQRPQSNILTHCYLFFPRTLRVWNSLPCEVVTSPSLDIFRHTALPAIRSLKVPSHLRRL